MFETKLLIPNIQFYFILTSIDGIKKGLKISVNTFQIVLINILILYFYFQ